MLTSLLLLGDSSSTLQKILAEYNHQLLNNPDLFLVDKESGYGIAEIRKIASFLLQKPFSHSHKLVLIENIHKLKTEAQNALLKSLEEPGEQNMFILTTRFPLQVLPTIFSRCQIINCTASTNAPTTIQKLNLDLTLPEKLTQSELLAATHKESFELFLETQIQLYYQELLINPTLQTQATIKKLFAALSMYRHNLDPKQILDWIFLS